MRLLLTAEQVSEHTRAEALMDDFRPALTDKSYDSDAFVETFNANSATPVIRSGATG